MYQSIQVLSDECDEEVDDDSSIDDFYNRGENEYETEERYGALQAELDKDKETEFEGFPDTESGETEFKGFSNQYSVRRHGSVEFPDMCYVLLQSSQR